MSTGAVTGTRALEVVATGPQATVQDLGRPGLAAIGAASKIGVLVKGGAALEALGRVRRAISVVKKRAGSHEDTIREYRIGSTGLAIGEPVQGFQGVLRGTPTFVGGVGDLPPVDGNTT